MGAKTDAMKLFAPLKLGILFEMQRAFSKIKDLKRHNKLILITRAKRILDFYLFLPILSKVISLNDEMRRTA
jgi:hypothetical protein